MKRRFWFAFCATSLLITGLAPLQPAAARAATVGQDTNLAPIAASHTHVLDAASLDGLATQTEAQLGLPSLPLHFARSTPTLRSLRAGDIIVAGVSRSTPEGLLRAVTGVTSDANGVTLMTAPAGLNDAMVQGSYNVGEKLTSDKIRTFTALRPGVAPAPRTDGSIPCYTLANVSIYSDGAGNSITANGRLCLSASVHFGGYVKWSGAGVSFSASASDTAHLQLLAKGGLSFNKSIDLLKLDLTPITFSIGPIPVVIIPRLTFSIGANGKVTATMTAGATQTASFNVGVTCGIVWFHSPSCSSNGPNLSNSFSADPVSFSGQAQVTGYANLKFAALLYGVIGGNIAVQGYVEADANTAVSPPWIVYAGLKLLIGFDLDLWRIHEHPSYTLVDLRTVIAQAPPHAVRAQVDPAFALPEGRPISVTVRATDVASGAPIAGRVIMNGQDVGPTNTPLTLTFYAQPTGVVRAAGYPDAPINWPPVQPSHLHTSITPYPVPLAQSAAVTVTANDADSATHEAVAGTVTVHTFDALGHAVTQQFPTDTTAFVIFRTHTHRVRECDNTASLNIPITHCIWVTETDYPDAVVSAPGFATQPVDLGLPS